MNKFEQVILTYTDEDGELVERTFKNATFGFDSVYTTVFGKKNDLTIKTDTVVSIECKGKYESPN